MIEYNELFFSRIDKFQSDLEGMYSQPNLTADIVELKVDRDIDNNPKLNVKSYTGELNELEESNTRKSAEVHRRCSFANCWYRSEYESSSQWKIFAESGVAIQSTTGKLKQCFSYTNEQVNIFHVKYIDYSKDRIEIDNAILPLIHKPNYYANEKELRAILFYVPSQENISKFKDINGRRIRVDLNVLLENIYLYPKASAWVSNLITEILKKYGLSVPLKKSEVS